METFIIPASQLGGTVFTVVAFLWYLTKLLKVQEIRDKEAVMATNKQSKSNIILAKSLQELTDIIDKNKSAIDKNTNIVNKNTNVIKKTVNGE